jgi:hypothetical protein
MAGLDPAIQQVLQQSLDGRLVKFTLRPRFARTGGPPMVIEMTPTPRLKAGIFVRALLRRVQVVGASAFVVRSGAEEAGAIILKISKLDGTVLVLNQVRDAKGELAWAQPLAGWTDEKRAADWCDKQVKFDPDLWIVEIEDREGRTFVDEPVV